MAVMPEPTETLFRTEDHLPLGPRHDLVTPTDATPSHPDVRPFGLRFATAAAPV